MTLTIDLQPETEQKVRLRAAQTGQDVSTYISQLIQNDLQSTDTKRNGFPAQAEETATRPKPTLDEILAPIREEFERSGMSEEELEQLLVEARDEVRREKRLRRGE